MEYHVSKRGSDSFDGSKNKPFLTISRAAQTAEEGDTVIVHEGVYRECVSPQNGARYDSKRIVYRAAEHEKAIIKGSEQIIGWENKNGKIWSVKLPNTFFGTYNPYAEVIDGDWFMSPLDRQLHTGQVYLDGVALKETNGTPSKMEWSAKVTDE